MMVNHDGNNNRYEGPISPCYTLFEEMQCFVDIDIVYEYDDDDNDDFDRVTLANLDLDRMRCHILDCLVALRSVEKKKRILKINREDEEYELAKSRVFNSAIPMIMNDKETVDDNNHILAPLLSPFPDKEMMTDGLSWLPLHFALALGDKIKEEDINILHARDPIAMQRYSLRRLNRQEDGRRTAYLPGHFLCMQKFPNMSLMKYLSMCDMRAFTMRISFNTPTKAELMLFNLPQNTPKA
jgi:hypothetical protein